MDNYKKVATQNPISYEEYEEAVALSKTCDKTVQEYHKSNREIFKERMRENPIFDDDELRYSATAFCDCGHGMAYPKDCDTLHYWSCSAILKGMADGNLPHTEDLPFTYYSVKAESDSNGSTRGRVLPNFS